MVRGLMGDQPGGNWNRVGLASFSDRSDLIFHMRQNQVDVYETDCFRNARIFPFKKIKILSIYIAS